MAFALNEGERKGRKRREGREGERERGGEREGESKEVFAHPVLFMLTLLDRESCEAQILFRLPPNLNDEIELERDEVREPRPNDAGASIRALIG